MYLVHSSSRRRSGSAAVAVVVLGLAAASAAFAGGSHRGTSAKAGVLRIAVTASPDSFDPALLQSNSAIELTQNVFDGLVDESSQMKVVPAIASSWKVSNGGKVYTFNLRRDVRFQNGDPVTAQDFVYSLNRTLSPKLASPNTFLLGDIAGADAVTKGKAKTASGIRAVGPYTLRITLTHAAGYFPSLVSRWPAWVVDAKVVGKSAKWASPGTLVGTGPFTLSSAVGDSQYTFTANPSYFAGKPKLSRVQVTVLPSSAAAVARYEAGDFDAVINLDAPAIQVVNSSATLKAQLHSQPILRTVWLGMAFDKPPFNDIKVRQAFNHAIDRTTLIKVAAAGQATPGSGWLPAGLPGSIASTTKPYSYNPTLAKQLFSQAGYPNGQGFPSLDLYYTLGAGTYQQVFEFIQNQLQQNLNIRIGLKAIPHNDFNATMADASKRPIFYAYGFGLDYPDAQEQTTYLGITGAPYNLENYSNPKYDSLVNAANASSNQAKRAALYAASERLRFSQAVDVVLYYPTTSWLVKPYVHGFGESPLYMKKWLGVSVTR